MIRRLSLQPTNPLFMLKKLIGSAAYVQKESIRLFPSPVLSGSGYEGIISAGHEPAPLKSAVKVEEIKLNRNYFQQDSPMSRDLPFIYIFKSTRILLHPKVSHFHSLLQTQHLEFHSHFLFHIADVE